MQASGSGDDRNQGSEAGRRLGAVFTVIRAEYKQVRAE